MEEISVLRLYFLNDRNQSFVELDAEPKGNIDIHLVTELVMLMKTKSRAVRFPDLRNVLHCLKYFMIHLRS